MKKVFLWIGVVSLVIVTLFIASVVYLSLDEQKYDKMAEPLVRRTVNDLSDLSEQQFNAYWGDKKPGTEEYRKKLIAALSRLGVLKSIDSIEVQSHYSSITTQDGIVHTYTYIVKATYTNGPATITIKLRGAKGRLSITDLKFNSPLLL